LDYYKMVKRISMKKTLVRIERRQKRTRQMGEFVDLEQAKDQIRSLRRRR